MQLLHIHDSALWQWLNSAKSHFYKYIKEILDFDKGQPSFTYLGVSSSRCT